MSRTWTTLVGRIRAKADQAGAGGVFDNDHLLIYFNEAQDWAWPLFPNCVFTSSSRNTSTHTVASPVAGDGVQAFTKHANNMRTLSMSYTTAATGTIKYGGVVWEESRDALYSKMKDASNWTAGVEDCHAAIENDQIFVGPVYAGDIFVENYLEYPTELTAVTSTCELPDAYTPILEDKTVATALGSIGSPKAGLWLTKAENGIVAVYQRFNLKPPPMLVHVTEKK
jgi:hypothetical protein